MIKMFFENENARCGKCKRILFKKTLNSTIKGIEIKCHSCKAINYSDIETAYQFMVSALKKE